MHRCRCLAPLVLVVAVALSALPVRGAPPDDAAPRLANAADVARILERAYSATLRGARAAGHAHARVFVNDSGAVDSVAFVALSGVDPFDQAAASAARAARFQPAVRDGAPASAWADLRFRFEPGESAVVDWIPPQPALANRDELLERARAGYPEELKRSRTGARVIVSLLVDGEGRATPRREIAGTCHAGAAALVAELIAAARFEPTTGSPADRRVAYATVLFGRDSVRVAVTGPVADTVPRAVVRSAPAGESAPPQLRNPDAVTRALQDSYPRALARQGIAGEVRLWVFVDEQGRPAHKLVTETSGHCVLDAAAEQVVERMRFRPAHVGGEPLGVFMELPLSFRPRR
jgi:TonB family protein